MKKALKVTGWFIGSLIVVIILTLLVSSFIYSPQYIARVLINGESKINDYSFFSSKIIEKSSTPYHYDIAFDDSIGASKIEYPSDDSIKTVTIDEVFEKNSTTSAIIIRNDKIIYEKYFNGHVKNFLETFFSSVKSLDSLMIGMEIEDGCIESEKQKISDYITEFKGADFQNITIENLLMMRSKIKYVEGFAYFTDDAKTYYYPDLRDLTLNHMKIDKNYTGKFHYNNYHPLLLGIILERSTGMSVSDYFQKKIWDAVGAENDASWSIDSEKTKFEKMESGLNFQSVDYVKIGSMLLHKGDWNGRKVVNEDWISRSTIASTPLAQDDIDSEFLKGKVVGYKYMWYSRENERGGKDFFASGKYGQYLYVSPENNTVIVRTGAGSGEIAYWPDVLKQIAAIAGEK